MENAQICLNGQREEAPGCPQCWNPVALNLIWTVPSRTAPTLYCELLHLCCVCPESDLPFPVSGSVASAPRPPRPQCVGGQVEPLMHMAWSPSIDSWDGSLPLLLSLPLSLFFSSAVSLVWTPHWPTNDTSLPALLILKLHAQGAGAAFSNPKQRTGAGLVNKPFLQRGGESSPRFQRQPKASIAGLPRALISWCVVDSEHMSAQHLLTSGAVNVPGEGRGRPAGELGAGRIILQRRELFLRG